MLSCSGALILISRCARGRAKCGLRIRFVEQGGRRRQHLVGALNSGASTGIAPGSDQCVGHRGGRDGKVGGGETRP